MTGPNYDTVPGDNGAELRRYIEQGVPTGGFLEAVLANDLEASRARADAQNRPLIFHLVHWLANNAPRLCWGSQDMYDAWLSIGGQIGIAQAEEDAAEPDDEAVRDYEADKKIDFAREDR